MNSKEIIGSVFGVALKVIAAIIVVMLVYKYAVTGYEYGYRIFGEQPITTGEGRDIDVAVPDGASVKEIGQILENKGLIRDAKLFVFQEKVSEYKGLLQPGEYVLNTSMSAEEMMAVMAAQSETENTTEEAREAIENLGLGESDSSAAVSEEETE